MGAVSSCGTVPLELRRSSVAMGISKNPKCFWRSSGLSASVFSLYTVLPPALRAVFSR